MKGLFVSLKARRFRWLLVVAGATVVVQVAIGSAEVLLSPSGAYEIPFALLAPLLPASLAGGFVSTPSLVERLTPGRPTAIARAVAVGGLLAILGASGAVSGLLLGGGDGVAELVRNAVAFSGVALLGVWLLGPAAGAAAVVAVVVAPTFIFLTPSDDGAGVATFFAQPPNFGSLVTAASLAGIALVAWALREPRSGVLRPR